MFFFKIIITLLFFRVIDKDCEIKIQPNIHEGNSFYFLTFNYSFGWEKENNITFDSYPMCILSFQAIHRGI